MLNRNTFMPVELRNLILTRSFLEDVWWELNPTKINGFRACHYIKSCVKTLQGVVIFSWSRWTVTQRRSFDTAVETLLLRHCLLTIFICLYPFSMLWQKSCENETILLQYQSEMMFCLFDFRGTLIVHWSGHKIEYYNQQRCHCCYDNSSSIRVPILIQCYYRTP